MSISTIGIPYPLLRHDVTSLASFKASPTVNLPDGRKQFFIDTNYSYEFIIISITIIAEDSPRIIHPDDFGSSGKVWIRTSQVEISDAIHSAGEWRLSPPPANEIVINSLSDFAVQSETTITLEDNKNYIPGASIVTSKRFIVGNNVSIFGAGPNSARWEYTGTGSMFTGVDVVLFNMSNFAVKCLNAQIFDFTDTTPLTLFNIFNFTVNDDGAFTKTAEKFGTFNNIGFLVLTTVGVSSTQGITLTGGFQFLSFVNVTIGSFDASFIGLDLGASVVSSFFNISAFALFGLDPGSVGISGLTNSGNIGSGIQAGFENCTFNGNITPLVGITSSDLRIQFRNCHPIPDSTIDFFSSMTVMETVVISSIGIFVPISGGNWDTTKSSRWSVDIDGVATYIYPRDTDIQMTANASLTKVGGGSNKIAMRINVDTGSGFPVPPPIRTEAVTDSTNATNLTSADIVTISEGHKVRIEVANLDSTSDVVVSANARFMSINGF